MRNLSLQIILSVYFCLAVLAIYNVSHNYSTNKKHAKEAVEAKLSTVAKILANQIEAGTHQKITDKFSQQALASEIESNAEYKKIHKILKETKTDLNISSPIYTLFKSADANQLLFGVTSSENNYYRHYYETPPTHLINNFEKGGFIDEYKDENGIWLSHFEPIKNDAGETVAIVQVDENFRDFKNLLRAKFIENLSIIGIIYLLIGIVLFIFLKKILTKEAEFVELQKEYHSKLEKEVNDRTKELSIVNSKLNSVNNELSSFFYSTSHDIRGPLCRILGLSSLAKHEDDNQQLVELIEQESQKMDDMLKKMILVNNVRTKELQIEDTDISANVNWNLRQLKQKYDKTKAEITIKTETQRLHSFHSDKSILDCIIANLLDNAFKFSDAEKPKIIVTSYVDPQGILSLIIANNGEKFSDAERADAFHLFKKADLKGDTTGIKLGLYTVKTAVDKLNGVVDVTEVEGLSAIRVLIPDYYKIANLELNMMENNKLKALNF